MPDQVSRGNLADKVFVDALHVAPLSENFTDCSNLTLTDGNLSA